MATTAHPTPIWTAHKLCVWSNRNSTGAEIWLVNVYREDEPVYVGSYAALLKPGAYEEGFRLFRASYARDTIRGIQSQLEPS